MANALPNRMLMDPDSSNIDPDMLTATTRPPVVSILNEFTDGGSRRLHRTASTMTCLLESLSRWYMANVLRRTILKALLVGRKNSIGVARYLRETANNRRESALFSTSSPARQL